MVMGVASSPLSALKYESGGVSGRTKGFVRRELDGAGERDRNLDGAGEHRLTAIVSESPSRKVQLHQHFNHTIRVKRGR